MPRVKNPKPAPSAFTLAQLNAVKTFVDAMPDNTRFATFDDLRAAVPSIAAMSDGALHALLLSGGYSLTD